MTKFNHFEQLGSENAPIFLPEDFPVKGASLYEQTDKDITMLHFHECLEIGYCYEGSGIFVMDDRIFPFQGGDATLIQAGRMHLAQSTKGTTSKWRFLSLDALTLTNYFKPDEKKLVQEWQVYGKSKIIKKESQPKAMTIIHDIIEEFVAKNKHYQSVIKLKVGELVMQTIRDDSSHIAENKIFNEKKFQRILPAIQTIIRNYADPIKIDHLADLCYLSPAQFRRTFLSAMNASPQSYLISIRLNHADQLLQTTDLKIVNIAQQVGFSTLSSFNRAYQLTRKRTPKDSRRRQ